MQLRAPMRARALLVAVLLLPSGVDAGPASTRPVPTVSAPSPGLPPPIALKLKPRAYEEMIKERDVPTRASLEKLPGDPDEIARSRYSYVSAMLVHASLSRTRKVLTDYAVYAKVIPYIQKAQYSPITRTLYVTGGVWKYVLQSAVQFEEVSDRWIRYRILQGHFSGLTGNIVFEPMGEKGTAVLFDGELTGTTWPPKLVVERGAEIVFGFTAKRMRNYIERQEDVVSKPTPGPGSSSRAGAPPAGAQTSAKESQNDLPQPRKRLPEKR